MINSGRCHFFSASVRAENYSGERGNLNSMINMKCKSSSGNFATGEGEGENDEIQAPVVDIN